MKIQKPIDVDAHFKYRCTKCGCDHWVSIREAKTNRFKVVCDCGSIFIPKRIKKIKIIYYEEVKKPIPQSEKETVETAESGHKTKTQKTINTDLLERCTKLLVAYGFTKPEAQEMLEQAYIENPTDNSGLLVREALKLIGANK